MRTLLLWCITFAALVSSSVRAGDTKEYLEFYAPFVAEDIAKLVQPQQDALDVTRNMPKRWFEDFPHTHVALSDAIEQGALFCNMLKESRSQ